MKFRGVALVLGKAVMGELRIEANHDAIAGDLGDDAGGGDALGLAVAFDDGGMRHGKRADGAAIDEGVLGNHRESKNGAPHSLVRGAVDVNAIDLVVLDDGDGPVDIRADGDGQKNFLAVPGSQFFGIVDECVAKAERQDDGGSHHRPGKGAAAGFIDAGNPVETGLAQCILMFERAAHGLKIKGGLLADSHCLLALAATQVIELGAARGAGGLDLNPGDAR